MRYKVLQPLKPCVSQAEIIAFDTEDNSEGAPDNFICASFYSEKEQITFFDREEAREYMLLKRKEPVTFFAHNLAYDLANLDYPENSVKQFITGSKIVAGFYKYGERTARFMDTGNFFVGESIESLGDMFGVPKLEFDINRIKNKKIKDLSEKTKEDVAKYCMKDSEICYKTAHKLMYLCNENKTKFKCYTAGGMSLRIFRTNFMTEEWPCRKQYINDFERTAYYGGRTEVFNYNKHGRVFYEDINSSYPTAMFYEVLPKPWSYSLIRNLEWKQIKNKHGISLVTVSVPKTRIPPLPYRQPGSGKLIFPYGQWTASYTHPELVMAEKYGCKVLDVHQSILYCETFQPFKDYIKYMHAKKSNAPKNSIERSFYKMLMNALSGKLGEKREVRIRVNEEDFKMCYCDNPNFYDNKCKKCEGYDCGGKTVAPDDNGWVNITGGRLPDPVHSFPVLIAYITAYGRMKLYEDRLRFQDSIYCDTDSAVSPSDYTKNRGNELGKWNLDICHDFLAYAPKFYNFLTQDEYKFKMRLKGVPKRHKFGYRCSNNHEIIFDECNKVCKDDHNLHNSCKECNVKLESNQKFYLYEKPIKLSEAIHRKEKPNKWEVMEKIVSVIDNKRVKLPNGDSEPLFVNDVSKYTFQEIVDSLED